MTQWRTADLFKGALYALLLDLAWVALVLLLPLGGAWILVVVWAMAVLAITGFSIAEEKYMMAGGFWLGQMLMFTLWMFGFFSALQLLQRTAGS